MIRTDGSHCQRKRERAGGEVEMRFYLRLSELTFWTCLCAREITRESLSIKKWCVSVCGPSRMPYLINRDDYVLIILVRSAAE